MTVHADMEQPWTAITRFLCLVVHLVWQRLRYIDIEKLGTLLLLIRPEPTIMLSFLL